MSRNFMDCRLINVVLLFSFIRCILNASTDIGDEIDGSVHRHEDISEVDPERIRQAEKHFLNLLGVKRKPRKRRGLHVPDYMWNLYHSWTNNDLSDLDTNTVRVLHPHEEFDECHSEMLQSKETIKFDVAGLPRHEKMRLAELHIYRKPKETNTANLPQTNRQAAVKVYVSRASGHPCKKRKRKHMYLVSKREINMLSSGWEVFNVTKSVNKWMKRSTRFAQFKVKIYRNESDVSHEIDMFIGKNGSGDEEAQKSKPFLIVRFDDGSGRRRNAPSEHASSRVRRYVDNDPELPGVEQRVYELHQTGKREICRRRQMYLNFGAVGWNEYIIAPAGYHVYFCGGICPKPLGPHLNTTNHAVIQNQVNSFDPNLAPPPCCVPTLLGDITILFLNEHYQITLKKYKNMVAFGCGCR